MNYLYCKCGCGTLLVVKRKNRIPTYCLGHATKGKPNNRVKGKTYEEIYGTEKAKLFKFKLSEVMKKDKIKTVDKVLNNGLL